MEEVSNFQTVGKGLPQIDSIKKANGEAKYTVDMKLPRMLHAKILLSPYAHANILKIDKSESEKIPGVRAVLTFEDIPKVKFNAGAKFNHPLPLPDDEYILSEKARFVGDKIAAVAAESEEIAEKALKAIKVDYEELPAMLDVEEAMKPGAPKIHDKENNIVAHISSDYGNVENGFKEADFIFEDEFRPQGQQHLPMEPHACIADCSSDGSVTIWTCTQCPFQIRYMIAKIMNIPQDKVRVIKPYMGGGFGGKEDMFDEAIAVVLSKKTGRPVKLVADRKRDLSAMARRHPAVVKVKIGVKKDGTITAAQMTTKMDAGAYCTSSPRICGAHGGRPLAIYRLPNYKFDGYTVYTNTLPSRAFRGYGNPQMTFSWESMLDMIAEKLGIDRIEIRLRNCTRKGDLNRLTGGTIESCGIQDCIKQGAEAIGWDEKKSKVMDKTKRRGFGMAMAAHWTSSVPRQPESAGAVIVFAEDGTVNLLVGAADLGQGSDTVLSQIAAEELGLELKDVTVTSADTKVTPWDAGTYSSKVTYLGGNTVKLAAADAKNKLIQKASKILGVHSDALVCKNKRVFVKANPNMGLSFAELMEKLRQSGEPQIIGTGNYGGFSNPPTYVAHFAEVAVDTETGEVSLLRYVAAQDPGTPVNPILLEGQMEGGVQQGLGYALTERFIFDKKTGVMLNPTLMDYSPPFSLDMPPLKTILVPTYEPTGPFGAKGMSEGAFNPVAPAVANAIYDAVGVRIKSLPITAEKILAELEKKEMR